MLTPLNDDSCGTWIERETRLPDFGGTMASIVPPVFPAYALIAHAIHLAPGLQSLAAVHFGAPSQAASLIDQELKRLGASLPRGEASVRSRSGGTITTRFGQVRVSWQEVSAHLGKVLGGPASFSSLWDLTVGDWPDDVDGPVEGSLTQGECEALIDVLTPFTNQRVTFLYRWANTKGWTGRCDSGNLGDVLTYFEMDEVSGTPEYWWSDDRSWIVCTDYDCCYTLMGGSDELIASAMRHPGLECHLVSPIDALP